MDTGHEGVRKDIPAERTTVDAIALDVRRITEGNEEKDKRIFRVGGAESGTTLHMYTSFAPWRNDEAKGSIHTGQEILLVEKEDILDGDEIKPHTSITPFYIDTKDPSPRLLIDADGTDGYMSTPDPAYRLRETQRHVRPFDTKWKPSPEDQAQKLLAAVSHIDAGDEIADRMMGYTKAERPAREEVFRQITDNTSRIFAAAEGFILDYGNSEQVSLRLGAMQVTLFRDKNGIIRFAIERPLHDDHDMKNTATE